MRHDAEALTLSEDERRRNSPVSKNRLSLILSAGATPEQEEAGSRPCGPTRICAFGPRAADEDSETA